MAQYADSGGPTVGTSMQTGSRFGRGGIAYNPFQTPVGVGAPQPINSPDAAGIALWRQQHGGDPSGYFAISPEDQATWNGEAARLGIRPGNADLSGDGGLPGAVDVAGAGNTGALPQVRRPLALQRALAPTQAAPMGAAGGRFGPSRYWADSVQATPQRSDDIVSRDRNQVRYYHRAPGGGMDQQPYRVDSAPAGSGYDPTTGAYQGTLPSQQGGRRFSSANGSNLEGEYAPLADYFLRGDTSSGITTEPIPQEMYALLDKAKAAGVIRENASPGGAPGAPGGGVAGAPGGAASGAPNAMSPNMIIALNGQMTQAAAAAHAYSQQTGIVHLPNFDAATGRWSYTPVTDPTTGQPMTTLEAQRQNFDIQEVGAKRAYDSLLAAGYVADPVTGERHKTAAVQQWEQTFGEGQRQYDANLGQRKSEYDRTFGEGQRQFDARLGLDTQRQAFDQEASSATLASKPRNYIESFLRGQRTGMPQGVQANNQAAPTTRAPGQVWANAMQGGSSPALGTVGAADHYATQEGADGSKVHYYGSVNETPQGNQVVPVGAFGRAILSGQSVSSTGNLSTPGGYAQGDAIRAAYNPNNFKPRDYNAGTPGERAQLASVGDYAGVDEADTNAALAGNTPRQGSISGGLRMG